MRKIILLVLILFITVAISGCTSKQTPQAKNYSANGLSFTYPGNWEEMDISFYQNILGDKGEALVLVGDESNSAFGIARIKEKNQTLNDLLKTYNSTLNIDIQYISEEPITVDNVKRDKMMVKAFENYFTGILFEKNGITYLIISRSPNNDQQVFDQIIKSLKIS